MSIPILARLHGKSQIPPPLAKDQGKKTTFSTPTTLSSIIPIPPPHPTDNQEGTGTIRLPLLRPPIISIATLKRTHSDSQPILMGKSLTHGYTECKMMEKGISIIIA
jgi:hypothetical protein